MERLAGAGGVAEGTRSRAREEALGAGYDEEELTIKKGFDESQALLADLRRVCMKYDAEAPGEATVENLEDLERVARRIKSATRAIRLTVGKESPLDVAVGRLGMLKKWRVEIETAQIDLQASQTAVEEHGKEHGKPEQWAGTRSSLLEAIERSEGALHVLDIHGKVVADAIAYLEAVPSSRECPVCGDPKEAAKLASLLRTKISKGQATEVRRLREEVAEAKLKIRGPRQSSRHDGVGSWPNPNDAPRRSRRRSTRRGRTLAGRGKPGIQSPRSRRRRGPSMVSSKDCET